MRTKPKHKTGIRKKIAFLIYSIIALNAILGVSLGYYLGFNLLRDTIEENRRQTTQILASYISHIIDDEIKIIGGDKVTIDNANLRASLTHFKIGKTGHAILIDKKIKEDVYKKKQFVICEKIENAFLSEKGFDWDVCVMQELGEAYAPLNMLFLQMITVAGAVTLFPIVLVFFATGALVKPFIEFRKEIEKIGSKGLDYKINMKTGDEIEELADSFNSMAETLQKTLVKRGSLVKEIAERRKAEEEVRRTAEEWTTTFNSIADPVFILDKDYRIIKTNKAFRDAFNIKEEEAIGQFCYAITHGRNDPLPECPCKETLMAKKAVTKEFFEPKLKIYLQTSTSPIFDEKGNIAKVVHILKDITERKAQEEKLKEAEAQLLQAEKLVSIGQLAAGMAHEINNPLTAISGEAEMLLRDKAKDKDVKEATKVIVEQAKRIKIINERLLVFSRKKEIKLEPLDINKTLKKSIALITPRAKMADVEMREDLGLNLPKVFGDDNELQEVFLNIMLNAVQAMENEKKKLLAVKTSKRENAVLIEFEDTGKGMDGGTIKSIYDPFFTTKKKHTGLGLSLCYGIIRSHKGDIGVHSEIGKGSTFTVRLPAIRKEEG